ncbi:MAG: prepilin-type N-terminal cleavage/methylation domain-containing protein [Rubrivivax sp.]|nr:prepilin-type N-terminal cleavage/methylation domain-containing protein [Rubrivivax sp.]MDP3615627.1 prepilin-type N-terminal cleavage/methylation domain-containing protein [Rubrivivax sp.]
MPTSVPGSKPGAGWLRGPGRTRGFTIVELLIVIAVVAVAVSLVAVALPDGEAAKLDEEGERLIALLETARAESRVSGAPVIWLPGSTGESGQALSDLQGRPVHFRFVGVPAQAGLPSRWLDARVVAQVVGAPSVVLGPSAILRAQRIVLGLEGRRIELFTDGLSPFAVATEPGDAAVLPNATPR